MTTSSFNGLMLGSAIALTAALRSTAQQQEESPWQQESTAEMMIQKTIGDVPVAPAGVWLEATNLTGFSVSDGASPGEVYDPSFHEITYIWTVRGKPLPAYSAPQNMIPQWNDANVAYGRKVAFTLTEPGTYTIDLFAVGDDGKWAVAETEIQVASPDDVYPGQTTVCFSNDPSETWDGAPLGSLKLATVAAVQGAVENATVPIRVLLKRGQTVTDFSLYVDDDFLGYLGAWGTGANPIVTPPRETNVLRFWNGTSMSPDFTLTGLSFEGGWDSTTETGYPDVNPLSFAYAGIPQHLTVHGNTFSGFQTLQPFGGKTHDYTTVFSDNVVTNWRDYGVYCMISNTQSGRAALIGNRIAQHVDALNGGKKNGLHNTHGPFRGGSNADTYLAVNDMFSRCGWSGLGIDKADQPCVRLNYAFKPNVFCTLDRNVFEGGFKVIITQGNDTSADPPGNYLLDKNLCVASAKTISCFVNMERGGTTIRNLVGVMPDVPYYHENNAWHGGVNWRMDAPTAANQIAPIAVYNSSFISARSASNDLGHTWVDCFGQDAFFNATIENNLVDARTLQTPVVGPVNMGAAIPGVSPRYKGVRFGFAAQSGTHAVTVSDNGSFEIDYPTGTDQAFWLGLTDSTRHGARMIRPPYASNAELTSLNGDFSVAYLANTVQITNSSGFDWEAGTQWHIKLDRTEVMPAMNTAFSSVGEFLPMPAPTASATSNDNGRHAYDDFFGNVRPGLGGRTHTGASRPLTGNKTGALH